jgi:hypothetical protein
MRLVRSPAPAGSGRSEDSTLQYMELERGAPFCGNAACALHVRPSDMQVEGGGNWITLGDGRVFGRSRFGKVPVRCLWYLSWAGPSQARGSPELKRLRARQ